MCRGDLIGTLLLVEKGVLCECGIVEEFDWFW